MNRPLRALAALAPAEQPHDHIAWTGTFRAYDPSDTIEPTSDDPLEVAMHRLRLLFQKYLNLGVRPHFVQTVIERAEHSVIGWNSNTSAVRTKKLRMEKAVYDAERALEFEVARMQAHQRRQNWHQIAHSAVAGFGDPNYEAHLRHLINTADDGQVAMQIRHLVRARQETFEPVEFHHALRQVHSEHRVQWMNNLRDVYAPVARRESDNLP